MWQYLFYTCSNFNLSNFLFRLGNSQDVYNFMYNSQLFLCKIIPLPIATTIASFAVTQFMTAQWMLLFTNIIHLYPPLKFLINYIPASPSTMCAGRSTRPCGTLSLVFYFYFINWVLIAPVKTGCHYIRITLFDREL